jgi:hypothetical protein
LQILNNKTINYTSASIVVRTVPWQFFPKNILFMTSNPQTTNLVFLNSFHELFSVLAVEKENKQTIGPKQVFFLNFGQMKNLFSFSTAQLRKICEKIGENKIGGLEVCVPGMS